MSSLGAGPGHRFLRSASTLRTFPSRGGQGSVPKWSKADSRDLPLKNGENKRERVARGHSVLPGLRLADPRGRSGRVLGRGRPATRRGLPDSRGTPPAGRTRSHSKQPSCRTAAETRPPGPVLRLPARGPQSPLRVSTRTMARLVTLRRLGFLAHLIGGTWYLLSVAGQVGQPARLRSSWIPHPTPPPTSSGHFGKHTIP